MSSTPLISIDRKPTATSEHHRNTLAEGSLLPIAVDPYGSRQTWTYLQYLVPLVAIFLFPLIFAIYVFANGRIVAPERLARLAVSNPQVKGQIIAILATSLTATTRWALGGAATLLARKRLLRPRPVYEIDVFFNLTNISVIWDWNHRRRMAFLTWFLVVACGLLTSGFFTLFNPLPIDIPFMLAQEIDLGVDSNLWEGLYDAKVYGSLHGSSATRNSSASLSDIPDFLDSMTRRWVTFGPGPVTYPVSTFVTTFGEIYSVPFVGSTAGTLILTEYSESSSSSTDLQGTWINVYCSTGTVPLKATIDRHLSDPITGTYANYSFACPGSPILKRETARISEAMIVALDCPMEDGYTAIFFWPLLASSFDAVINVACTVSPQIGEVNLFMDPNLQAFNVTRKSSSIQHLPPVARNLTSLILKHVTRYFQHLPIFSYTEKAWHGTEYSNEDFQNYLLPRLVETVLSALFEFEASLTRFEIWKALRDIPPESIPPEALREVKGMRIKLTIGWEVKWTTLLGLLPLVTICIIAFAMVAMAWWSEGKLTVFNPMSPVSLLGATSVGEVVFPDQASRKTIGDPLDENVLITRVSYDKRGETWGLWSTEGSLEESQKGAG